MEVGIGRMHCTRLQLISKIWELERYNFYKISRFWKKLDQNTRGTTWPKLLFESLGLISSIFFRKIVLQLERWSLPYDFFEGKFSAAEDDFFYIAYFSVPDGKDFPSNEKLKHAPAF